MAQKTVTWKRSSGVALPDYLVKIIQQNYDIIHIHTLAVRVVEIEIEHPTTSKSYNRQEIDEALIIYKPQ